MTAILIPAAIAGLSVWGYSVSESSIVLILAAWNVGMTIIGVIKKIGSLRASDSIAALTWRAQVQSTGAVGILAFVTAVFSLVAYATIHPDSADRPYNLVGFCRPQKHD